MQRLNISMLFFQEGEITECLGRMSSCLKKLNVNVDHENVRTEEESPEEESPSNRFRWLLPREKDLILESQVGLGYS